MAKDTFLEAVATIDAEDANLRKSLIDSERQVKQSVGKMQTDFNRLDQSVQKTGQQTVSTGQVFAGFGAQMSAMGGTVGMVGGKVAGLGGAFSSLGTALFGIPGLVLAATAAFGIITAKILEIRQAIKDYEEWVEKAGQTTARRMEKQWAEAGKQADLLTARTRIMRATLAGPTELIREQERQAGAALEKQIELAKTRMGMIGEFHPARADVVSQLKSLQEQRVLIAQDANRKIATIEDQRRQAQLAREREFIQKQLELQRKREEAFKATPFGRIATTMAEMLQMDRLKSQMTSMLDQMKIPGDMKDRLRASLGIGALATGPRGAGVSPYAYMTGAETGAGKQVAQQERQLHMDNQRTTFAKRTASATETMVRLFTDAFGLGVGVRG